MHTSRRRRSCRREPLQPAGPGAAGGASHPDRAAEEDRRHLRAGRLGGEPASTPEAVSFGSVVLVPRVHARRRDDGLAQASASEAPVTTAAGRPDRQDRTDDLRQRGGAELAGEPRDDDLEQRGGAMEPAIPGSCAGPPASDPLSPQPALSPGRPDHGQGGHVGAPPQFVSNTKQKRRHVISVGPPSRTLASGPPSPDGGSGARAGQG